MMKSRCKKNDTPERKDKKKSDFREKKKVTPPLGIR